MIIYAGPVVVSAGKPIRSNCLIDERVRIIDKRPIDAGLHKIEAKTSLKVGTEIPRRARVYLLESRGKRQIAVTTSDDQGNYAFEWIADREYDLIAEDLSGTYRSVIANSVLPTPMP